MLLQAGTGRYAAELAAAIAASGDCELELFATSWAGPRTPLQPPPGARLHRHRIPGRLLGVCASFGLDASRLCGRPDLFHHTHFAWTPVHGIPQVATIFDCVYATHPETLTPGAGERLMRRTRRLASASRLVLVPTEASGRDLVRLLDVPAEKIRAIPLGSDHLGTAPDGEPPAPPTPTLLTVGSLEPRKGHMAVLGALEMLKQRGLRCRWTIAGSSGWQFGRVRQALDDSPCREDIEIVRGADDAGLVRLMQSATCMVTPSLAEGFGLPNVEAMRWNLPVITSHCEAVAEVVGDAALTIDPLDVEGLADAIERLVEDPGERRRLARTGRERAEPLTWAACARATAAAYREAAG